MLEFGYCIWVQPSKQSELYDLTDGFEPHISLQTNMTHEEAVEKFAVLSINPLNVKIIDAPYVTECKGFYALQYDVKIISGSPSLRVEDPHISFVYHYDTPPKERFVELHNLCEIFDRYTLMCCNSHYTQWKEIQSKECCGFLERK